MSPYFCDWILERGLSTFLPIDDSKQRARSIAADCTAVLGVGLLILGWQYAPQDAADSHPEQE